MTLKRKISISGLTDAGRVRDHNEDSIGQDRDRGLLVLADGMGGLKAGEVASAMAVEVVMREVLDVLDGLDAGEHDAEPAMRSSRWPLVAPSYERTKPSIRWPSQPQCAGMGTTSSWCCSTTTDSRLRTWGIRVCIACATGRSSRSRSTTRLHRSS